jgi:hypothetical protein
MGYYTLHELNVYNENRKPVDAETLNKLKKELGVISDYGDMLFQDEVKWYDAELDMLKISKKYPNYMFQLDGNGEETGDVWRTYYQNGKQQVAYVVVVYDEFDPEKLK